MVAGFSKENMGSQRILLWAAAIPIVLSMAIPMLFSYVETVLFKPVLY